jgi:hypothetical protein
MYIYTFFSGYEFFVFSFTNHRTHAGTYDFCMFIKFKYVPIYVYMYIYMYILTPIHMNTYTFSYIQVICFSFGRFFEASLVTTMYIYIYIYFFSCIYVCINVYMYITQVMCFSFGRFFEASLVTTMYRKVATDYSPLER